MRRTGEVLRRWQRLARGWPGLAASLGCVLLLTACGGGGSGSDAGMPPVFPNTAPAAQPGAAQSVTVGTLVTLDGSASTDADGDPLTYAWTLTTRPAGSHATLAAPAAPRASFTADVEGTYVATLVVSDGKAASLPVTVSVAAAAGNAAPVARAGANQSVAVGSSVTLDGSTSADANGDALTYRWILSTRPAGSAAALSGATSPRPAFTADLAGNYVATLVVNDGQADSAPATVLIVVAGANVRPVADAGASQNVLVGGLVVLDGSASRDDNPSDTLTYRWALTTRPAGSAAALSGAGSARPSFAADVAGFYVATLIVSDGRLDSEPATTVISAATGNVAPVAHAGRAQSVVTGQTVTLDGTQSTDANGDSLAYGWTLTTRPFGSNATLSAPTAARPTFTADRDGIYVATLVVTDGKLSSAPATVTVTAGPANVAPVAQAGPSQTVYAGSVVTLDGSGSTDANGDPLSYAWTLLSRPAGSVAALSSSSAVRPTFVADKEGSYVITLYVSDGKATSTGVAVVVTVIPAGAPQIVLSVPEPIVDVVRLSLDKAVSGTVTWFVNQQQVGTGESYTWDTRSLVNGTYAVVARIQSGPESAYEARRSINVLGSQIKVTTSVSGTTGTVAVLAVPTSPYGIVQVSAAFDGVPAGSLSEPNACASRFGCAVNNAYRFNVDAAAAKSGNHTMVFTVTDGSGSTQSVSVPVQISNPPTLSLSTPFDGAFVYANLQLAGTASTDKGGAVMVTARLGPLQILQTMSSPFALNYDLSSVPAGTYTLSVRATDNSNLVSTVERTVVVTASASFAYSPAWVMPAGGQLLAADGARVLYSLPSGSVRLRDLDASSEVTLAGSATLQYATDWQVMGDRAYAQAKDSDCTTSGVCVYEWGAGGTRRNLTLLDPHAGTANQENPVARDGYVIWTSGTGTGSASYTLYDATRQTFTKIARPAGANYLGNTDYDLRAVGNVVHFWYWGQTGGEGMSSTFDVFRWRSDTGQSTRVTTGGVRNIYTQVDGERAAWQQTPVGGNANNTFVLQSQPLTGGATTTWSTLATSVRLRDGLLAWVEAGVGGVQVIKAATTSSVYTLSNLNTSALLAVGGGQVAYVHQNKVYTFDAATGQSRMRVDALPVGSVFITGGSLVFTIGSTVYRVPL